MSQISLKSISGITSITTPAGVDNQLTVHTNDTTQRVKVTQSGIDVTGVVTATSFVGNGSNLTGISGVSVANQSDNRLITATGTTDALNGEANLTFDGDDLLLKSSTDGRRISFATDGTSHYMKYDNTLSGIILNGYGGIAFETNGTNERLRIDSSGRIQRGSDPSNLGAALVNIVTGGENGISLGKNQGGNVSSGDVLGTLAFQSAVGSQTTNSAEASIKGIAAENSTGSTAATDLAFFTKPTGTGPGSSPTERLRISSAGKVGINRSAPQYSMHMSPAQGESRIDLHMTNDTTGHNNTDGVQFGYQNSAGAYIWNFENTNIYFGTNNINRLIIETSASTAFNFRPNTNNVCSLGTNSHRWANIHTNDLNLSNEGNSNEVDGTWGQYTIQEGQDDLFLINRRNGKRYKFLLQEID